MQCSFSLHCLVAEPSSRKGTLQVQWNKVELSWWQSEEISGSANKKLWTWLKLTGKKATNTYSKQIQVGLSEQKHLIQVFFFLKSSVSYEFKKSKCLARSSVLKQQPSRRSCYPHQTSCMVQQQNSVWQHADYPACSASSPRQHQASSFTFHICYTQSVQSATSGEMLTGFFLFLFFFFEEKKLQFRDRYHGDLEMKFNVLWLDFMDQEIRFSTQ